MWWIFSREVTLDRRLRGVGVYRASVLDCYEQRPNNGGETILTHHLNMKESKVEDKEHAQ